MVAIFIEIAYYNINRTPHISHVLSLIHISEPTRH